MGATFSRLKNWTTEILTDTDLNAEIDNILNNLTPSGVDDYSTNAAQMQIQTNPGGLGSESLSTSLAGEVERLRFVIQRMIGSDVTYWYETPTTSLSDLVSALGGTGLPSNRISSGKTTGLSSQLNAFIPSGVSASLTLTASAVDPLIYYINGAQYSITSSLTLTGLTLANAANSTLTLNKPDMTGSLQWSKALGQYGTQIYVDGMNSGPTALIGQIAAFQATSGGTSERFISYIDTTGSLTNAWRGCFFNQTPSAIPAVALNDNDILILEKLTWIFANTNSSLSVTYNNPTIKSIQPTSPSIGDYWFDLSTTAWKTYNGTSWNAANATLVGMSVQSSIACVATRTFDAYKATSNLQDLKLERISNTQVQNQNDYSKISIFGNPINFGSSRPIWDITANLQSGFAESVSTLYYLYLTEVGSPMMTPIAPSQRSDLNGFYFPTETWRCVGMVENDFSSNLTVPAKTFRGINLDRFLINDIAAYRTGATTTADSSYPLDFAERYLKTAKVSTSSPVILTATDSVTIATIALNRGLWSASGIMQGITNGTVATASGLSATIRLQGAAAANLISARTPIPVGANNVNGIASVVISPTILMVTTDTTNCHLVATLDVAVSATIAVGSQLTAVRLDKLVGDL